MSDQEKYTEVFSHLCHILALSLDNKVNVVVENLVMTIISKNQQVKANDINLLIKSIQDYFGILLTEKIIQTSIDSLIKKSHLLKDANSNILVIDLKVKSEILQRIENANQLEEDVKNEWFDFIEVQSRINNQELPENWKSELWSSLKLYMAKAFRRHGVQTAMLLDPNIPINENDKKSLIAYLREAISQECRDVKSSLAESVIGYFFEDTTAKRVKYLSQLLDGTFTFFALSTNQQASEYLKKSLTSMSIFLDTNIIFGVLGLHSNPMNDVSKELIEFIRINKLPFKIYYHEETLKEIRNVIHSIGEYLKKEQISQAISRAAVKTGGLPGLELRYHEINSQTPIKPEIFLSKYEYIQDILSDLGFKIYRSSGTNGVLDQERFELIAEYEDYIKKNRPNRTKQYQTINHDIVIWQTVSMLRKKGVSPLDAGAFIITADYSLYSFDWYRLRKKGDIGSVILPNQFLQIIRPFVPSTDDFDRRFIETFAIPEFRTSNSGYEQTRSNVISYLNSYSGMSEAMASKILANELLMRDLKERNIVSEKDFRETIDSVILKDYENLIQDKETLEKQKDMMVEIANINEKEAQKSHMLVKELEGKFTSIDEHNQLLMAENASEYEKSRKLSDELKELNDKTHHQISLLNEEIKKERREKENIIAQKINEHNNTKKYKRLLTIMVFLFIVLMISFISIMFKWDINLITIIFCVFL